MILIFLKVPVSTQKELKECINASNGLSSQSNGSPLWNEISKPLSLVPYQDSFAPVINVRDVKENISSSLTVFF